MKKVNISGNHSVSISSSDSENQGNMEYLDNHELRLAGEYVNRTGCNVFLTGKAGTGKTTFLHHLKKNTFKRMIVTAPTGVAAINAGGVTLHSFFQLPFGPFLPGSQANDQHRKRLFRFSSEKINIMRNLHLLVIDEVSMVRSDMLDAVDMVLRHHRRNDRPFGGVQLLMIGDLHQLSPVVKPEEWRFLSDYYASPYFFSSHSISQTPLVTIELKHIFRQTDEAFIRLLNCVRNNRLDKHTLSQLNNRHIPGFVPDDEEGYITLTTHNATADRINEERLRNLKTPENQFIAEISGDFPEYSIPTPAVLRLKEGAQVMFLRNDASGLKRYFNGKIGTIRKVTENTIIVYCREDGMEIEVEPTEWENIKYTINPETKAIQEDIIGKFKQYPLKLAWAITIHKSQGLTFDKAVIDAQASFAHGQVYVALSRCRSLEGMVLGSPIPVDFVPTDKAVLQFDDEAKKNPPTEKELLEAKIDFQQGLLLDCFDFTRLRNYLNRFTWLILDNQGIIRLSGVSDIKKLRNTTDETIRTVGDKFRRQLRSIFSPHVLPEKDAHVIERIKKASSWFRDQFETIFHDLVEQAHIETDNSDLRKKTNAAIRKVLSEIAVKRAGIESCRDGFSPEKYLKAISDAATEEMPKKVSKKSVPEYTASDVRYPDLFEELKDWRTKMAALKEVAHFQIIHQRILIQIATLLPDNLTSLRKIKGIGKKTAENYGHDLIAIVSAFKKKHGITKVTPPKPVKSTEKTLSENKPMKKTDTRRISFDMFKKGIPLKKIAEERGLAVSTIEGHMCGYVESGEVDISELLSKEKISFIEKQLDEKDDQTLGQIKHALGDDFSYGEIKLVMAYRKFLKI